MTAYDKEAADNGNRVTTKVIEGKATPHTASIDKGSKKAEKKQKKQSVLTRLRRLPTRRRRNARLRLRMTRLSVKRQEPWARKEGQPVQIYGFKIISYPTLRGVHYANGYAYASDGYILFKEKADYPKEWEGTTRDKDGNLIDGKYPDAERQYTDWFISPTRRLSRCRQRRCLTSPSLQARS